MVTKTLLVTGGSGGIGTAICKLAATQGFNICLNYLSDSANAKKTVKEIVDVGGKAISIKADITLESEVHDMFERCNDELGEVTHLVNNAGVVGPLTLVSNLEMNILRKVLEVNVIGSFLCCKEAINRFTRNKEFTDFSIVNISSQASKHGSPKEWVHYAASKGAIDTLTIGLSKEVAPLGIRVNAVSPGLINTKIHEKSGYPDRMKTASEVVPLGRAGTSEEVAEVVLFLLSNKSSYVTGANISVGGGR